MHASVILPHKLLANLCQLNFIMIKCPRGTLYSSWRSRAVCGEEDREEPFTSSMLRSSISGCISWKQAVSCKSHKILASHWRGSLSSLPQTACVTTLTYSKAFRPTWSACVIKASLCWLSYPQGSKRGGWEWWHQHAGRADTAQLIWFQNKTQRGKKRVVQPSLLLIKTNKAVKLTP